MVDSAGSELYTASFLHSHFSPRLPPINANHLVLKVRLELTSGCCSSFCSIHQYQASRFTFKLFKQVRQFHKEMGKLVRKVGLEPTRIKQQFLRLGRLPIPPLPHKSPLGKRTAHLLITGIFAFPITPHSQQEPVNGLLLPLLKFSAIK